MGLPNGTTIVFGTSGFTGNIHAIGGRTETREAVKDSHIATTGQHTYIAGSLTEAGQTEITFEWDQSFSTFPPITAAAETITISFPLKSGERVKATEAGTGFLVAVTGPNLESDTLMTGSATIHWDGKTDVAYTAGSV